MQMKHHEEANRERSAGKQGDLALLGRLFREARPYWKGLLLFFAVSVTATPLALLTPVPLKIAVDSGLGDTPTPAILRAVLPGALTDDRGGVLVQPRSEAVVRRGFGILESFDLGMRDQQHHRAALVPHTLRWLMILRQ